jgi:hypothetical protein
MIFVLNRFANLAAVGFQDFDLLNHGAVIGVESAAQASREWRAGLRSVC